MAAHASHAGAAHRDAAPAREVIARSPADVLRLVVATALLAALMLVRWLFGDTLVGFASDLLRGLDAVPHWILRVLAIGIRVVTVVTLVLGLVLTTLHSGRRMLVTVGLGVLLGIVAVVLLDDAPHVIDAPRAAELAPGLGPATSATFPTAAGIGAVVAALTAGAPWLSRRWRRWGWVAVAGLALTRFAVSPLSFDSAQAVLLGWVAGAAVLVVLGAPTRRPTPASIADGLAASGLALQRLEPASVDARGSTPYFGTGPDGTRYFVKALGDDQRSADLLFRLYRWVQRHDLGDGRPFDSLRRAVEHEALLALAARDRGIPTPHLRALATADPNAFVLAYEAIEGHSLDGVPPEQITDEVLAAIWAQLGRLRAVGMAHRDLRLANLFLAADGEVWLIDFGFSELAASDLLLATDVAELVASSAAVVGAERATRHARASVDAVMLGAVLERLHPWALSGASRRALHQQPGLLDDLRARLAAP